MKKYECPCCGSETQVDIDLHSDGFTGDLFECWSCNAEWVYKEGKVEILSQGKAKQ